MTNNQPEVNEYGIPQPTQRTARIEDLWALNHAKNQQQALSRSRRHFWRAAAAIAVVLALVGAVVALVVW